MEIDYGRCPEIFVAVYSKEYINTMDFLKRADASIASIARDELGTRTDGFFNKTLWSDSKYRTEYLSRNGIEFQYAFAVSCVKDFRREFENFLSVFEIVLDQHGNITSINSDLVDSGISVTMDSVFLRNHRITQQFIKEYLS